MGGREKEEEVALEEEGDVEEATEEKAGVIHKESQSIPSEEHTS